MPASVAARWSLSRRSHGAGFAHIQRREDDGGGRVAIGPFQLPSGDTVGAAHGNPGTPAGIVRAKIQQGTWNDATDLSAYLRSHPVPHPEAGDFELYGTLFTMALVNGHFYAVEPNHGEIIRVNPGGQSTILNLVSDKEDYLRCQQLQRDCPHHHSSGPRNRAYRNADYPRPASRRDKAACVDG